MRTPNEYTVKGIKTFLKKLSITIRVSKIKRKDIENQNLNAFTDEEKSSAVLTPWQLDNLRNDFRHHHIAYCEFRGRTRNQIEAKTDNPPSDDLINEIKSKMALAMERIHKENADAS